MKGYLAAVVGLVVVIFAVWVGEAEARQRGGKGRPAAPHAPKAGPRPGAGKAHPAAPKAKAHPKAQGGMPKAAQKKKTQASPQAKKDAAKKKEERKELAKKKEERKELAKKKDLAKKKESRKSGVEHDPESIALLRAAHQKLHEADHDYGGHRVEALRHVGAALEHLGSSASSDFRTGSGNMPQQRSDAILREAKTKLATIRSRLSAMAAKSSHHGEARGAVDHAIREIDQALAVR